MNCWILFNSEVKLKLIVIRSSVIMASVLPLPVIKPLSGHAFCTALMRLALQGRVALKNRWQNGKWLFTSAFALDDLPPLHGELLVLG